MTDVTLVHITLSHPRTVPTGILYIAAVLERAGYGVDVRDYAVSSYRALDPAGFVDFLDGAAGVIGIGCMSDTLPFVVSAVRELKNAQPEKKIILGGSGPTGAAAELLAAFPFFDAVVLGEGEETVVELMDCLTRGERDDLRHVSGIACRLGEEVVFTPERDRIRDLDKLPLPLYRCVPMEDYPLVNMVSSRGCPYRCTFCDVAPLWKHRHYRRSVESVIDEMRFLKERYGKTGFEFSDETFVLKEEKVRQFCEGLRSAGLDVNWSCTGRVNLVSDELLDEMASCGCRALFFGVESGSDHVLEKVKKEFTVAEAVEVIRRTAERMHVVASFIWGYPFETDEDLLETLYLLVYLSQIGVDARLNRLAPFSLTPLYREYGDRLVLQERPGTVSAGDPFQVGGLKKEVAGLVRDFPEVFPEFYRFRSSNLEWKDSVIESLGRYWEPVSWPARPERVAGRNAGQGTGDVEDIKQPSVKRQSIGGSTHAGS